jgi:hypothetical protein
VTTGPDGRYSFAGVFAGAHTVDAAMGAASATINVDIPPDPTALPPPTLADFDLQL